MKTDTIFYRLFQTFPSIFFELIEKSPAEAENYQFASVEVKQLAFRLDGVFLPKADASESLIYFNEVQFQNDPRFYARFFAEIFLYLSQTELNYDWRGVVIYPSRGVESQQTQRYQELLDSQRIKRVYLNELGNLPESSLGMATVQLVVTEQNQAVETAASLIQRVQQELIDVRQQRELLQLIETILVYKLPRMSRREIEAMFSLSDLKQTRVYQEALEEGRLEGRQEGKLASVPLLLKLGVTVEQIAQELGLPIEKVREVASQQSDN